MPLTLAEYADHLDTRQDLNWPAPPEIKRAKAKEHLEHLPAIRAVVWSVYGTLLSIDGGELWFDHPKKFVMDLALEKTIQEFKMWKAMTRKPGQPSEYMGLIYKNVMTDLRMLPAPPGEKYPDIAIEKVWENIVKKLLQNEYTFNASFYGSLNDYSRKIAYFFHASLQGTACYPGAAAALRHVRESVGLQGLLDDGQCFTSVQLARGLKAQAGSFALDDFVPLVFRVFSSEVRGRKPSDRLFREMLDRLGAKNIQPHEVLYIGSSLEKDVAPARRAGMRSGLYAGDKHSLDVPKELWKQAHLRPDVLLTKLEQITEVVG